MNATRIVTILLAATSVARAQTADLANAPEPMRPVDILSPPPPAGTGTYPPGTYGSPWCGDKGCNGPVGRDGPITYEIYAITGPSLPVGGSELSGALKTGWTAGGGTKTLWFNPARDSAFIFDLGIYYTYNRGQGDKSLDVATPRTSPVVVDPFTGQQSGGQRIFPDGIASYAVRALNRTNFNFGVGRDWWLNGPANVGSEQDYNVRVGADFGGRWGTASVDLVPRLDPANYLSRSGVIHAGYIGLHLDGEKPMGSWIMTWGLRAEWSYTWTNLIPPQGGDIHDISILATLGARF